MRRSSLGSLRRMIQNVTIPARLLRGQIREMELVRLLNKVMRCCLWPWLSQTYLRENRIPVLESRNVPRPLRGV